MKKLEQDLFRWREELDKLQHEKEIAYGEHGGSTSEASLDLLDELGGADIEEETL